MYSAFESLLVLGVLAATALGAFAVYRWRQRQRVARIEAWIRDYLMTRYRTVPDGLHINCSDDPLWPVLVSFEDIVTRTRRRLRFSCPGPCSGFTLLGETEDPLTTKPPAH